MQSSTMKIKLSIVAGIVIIFMPFLARANDEPVYTYTNDVPVSGDNFDFTAHNAATPIFEVTGFVRGAAYSSTCILWTSSFGVLTPTGNHTSGGDCDPDIPPNVYIDFVIEHFSPLVEYFSVYYDGTNFTAVDHENETTTRIISFTPEQGETDATSSPVTFTLHAYINPNDVDFIHNFRYNFGYKSQPLTATGDTFLLDSVSATTTGDFYYSTTTSITVAGNYLVEAQLEPTYVFGIFVNPFAGGFGNATTSLNQYHQFVMGAATLAGALFQNGITNLQNTINAFSSTSSEALLSSCNPLSFNLAYCFSGLFVPPGDQVQITWDAFINGVMKKWPWGYAERFLAILGGTISTTSPPTISIHFPLGNPTQAGYIADDNFTLNTGDMLSGGSTLLNSVHTSFGGDISFRDVTEPFVELVIALAVSAGIFFDILSMRHHAGSGGRRRTKLS